MIEVDETFDVVVIGGGPAGEVAAGAVAGKGLSVALVERELFGGECSYWACIPSKALLRPVELRHEAKRIAGLGEPALNQKEVLSRRDRIAALDDSGQVKWVEGAHVTGIRGAATLVDERVVQVDGPDGSRRLAATHAVVIATGSDPVLPPIAGIGEVGAWTNREATRLSSVPRRLLVMGGGPVAVEMAQAVKGLGAEKVTLVATAPRLLERMEPFVSEMVLAALEKDGIDVRLGAEVKRVKRSVQGVIEAELGKGPAIEADELLVAAGRTPRTGGLGLERFRLESGKPLKADETMRVQGWLYAIGDVNGIAPLTHMGKYQGRVVAEAIAARSRGGNPGPHGRAGRAVPQVVFSMPQAASVGLTEAQAKEAGIDCRLVTLDLAEVPGASVRDDAYTGRATIVVDRSKQIVVGCTLVGPDVGELLHAATIAIVGKVPLETLWHAVPSFPTVSEFWLKLIEGALKDE